ncbi:fasciclin domain-containing protein [Flavobacterium sp. LB3P122]|uniref:fasciclin domain-containing protein n=1 Tax=Flavobacterium algoriphilum TaxID=3398738 RepID=UPI003A87E5AE
MIVLNLNYKRLLVSLLTIALVSCSNPWDDRQNNGDANLGVNLSEAIANTNEVSLFGALLVQTGYDKILAESKTYTVFAPTNEAIYQLDKFILNDAKALKQFVANHIALTAYSSVRSGEKTQIKMFSDKYLTFKGSTMIDDASIVTADHYAANGVFHIISKALTPKLNIWQYINSKAGVSATSDYLLSLKNFSIYKADIDAKVGAVPGFLADSLSNSYLKNVYNLNNEKNSYTLFLMQDAGYNAEVDKMKPYLIKTSNVPTTDSTAIYSKYFTLRDMAFPKAYKLNELPATLTSRFGVEVPIDKTQIVGEPIQLSNGIVYIMKKVDVPLAKRLVTTKIEGENNNVGFINGPRSAIYYRDKKDPLGLFNDVIVQNPGTAMFMLDYDAKDLYSTTYKVYWRAINDFQTNAVLQSLRFAGKYAIVNGTRTVSEGYGTLGPISVQPNFYEPVYIGEFTLDKARNINLISLIAANTSTNGNNSLTLDYLKFVPVLK